MTGPLHAVGFAAVVGRWGVDMRPPMFEHEARVLAGACALPLQVDHGILIADSRIVVEVGRALEFAYVEPEPPLPTGVLAFLKVDYEPAVRGVARGDLDGLSLGAGASELSLTAKPAYSDCRIIGVGEDAAQVWELLTGQTR